MRTLIALVVAAILFIPSFAPAFKTIRDGSGNLRETWTQKGDRVEIRDGDGNLSRQLNREGERIIIRDGSGNKIGEVDRGSGDQD